MKCPFCSKQNTQVIDSRLTTGGNCIRRRRSCGHCRKRFTTYEKSQSNVLLVIKKNGSREYFNSEKIKDSVLIACNKRPLDRNALDKCIDHIERQVYKKFKYEVPTTAIGGMVLDELRKVDKVAYIRFASVYREFKDLVDFVQEVNSVKKR